MKAARHLLLAGVLLTVAAGHAYAQGDFSPEMSFTLSDTKVNANPSMDIHVEQDPAEEELGHVTLRIPKGFNLADDEAIADGTTLGEGNINIHVGPSCHPSFPADGASVAADLPAEITEADRTDEQADAGVWAVWHVDVTVTSFDLVITGSPTTGFVLDADIPGNDGSCPPLVFDAAIAPATEDGTAILTNPKKPGKKTFSGTFTTAESPTTVTITQVIKITK